MEDSVQITNELERRIADAFIIFDHHGDSTIDVREVGTVLRFLGCVPTEQEVNEVIAATEEEGTEGEVRLVKFMPVISQMLMERRFEPGPPEKLYAAFEVLDPDKTRMLEKDFFAKIMMEEGEPFTQEEIDEMMTAAVDPVTGKIPYEYYLNQLLYYPKNSIFDVAQEVFEAAEMQRKKELEEEKANKEKEKKDTDRRISRRGTN